MQVVKPKRKEDPSILAAVRKKPCVLCGRSPVDASHIKSVGAGGPDTIWNVSPMCRYHHGLWHSFGPSRFLKMYPTFQFWLEGKDLILNFTAFGIKLSHPALLASSIDDK